MKAINYIFFSAVILFSLYSCKKGATGPTGPPGLTGANGPNTQYEILDTTITTAQWPLTAPYIVVISDNYLDNFTGSLVYVYASAANNSTTTYYPLPSPLPAALGGGTLTFDYQAYFVTLVYNNTSPPTGTLYVRIVVIPNPE
jgi:hypothetical protein